MKNFARFEARRYPQFSSVDENVSWEYIKRKLLPTPKSENSEILPLPIGKYNIIYADPPWQYWEGG